MAICKRCQQEMTSKVGCVGETYWAEDQEHPRIPYGDEARQLRWLRGLASEDFPCPDCGTPLGALHHPGCDKEECPLCGAQVCGCGCIPEAVAGVRRYLKRMAFARAMMEEMPEGPTGPRMAGN